MLLKIPGVDFIQVLNDAVNSMSLFHCLWRVLHCLCRVVDFSQSSQNGRERHGSVWILVLVVFEEDRNFLCKSSQKSFD